MHQFNIPDMSCGHCKAAVTEAVQSVDAQAKVEVKLDDKTVQVDSSASREQLVAALVEAGYPPA